ncbi:hypothetical protein IFM61392_08953 [Aspergillus lentulus]|nr:hypothetical protein CNMCM6069_006746 [Aspergillus lentulus]GFF83700.1 hypothetical protein IFM47457_06225 [Aspergillus lentulus]GFG15392.1 hypothetical protein IFM61392_08953 [Aspergillus lentulus]
MFAISSFSMLALEVHYGVGKPKTTLSVEHIERQFLFLWLSIPLYNLSLTFTKASILLLYLRIFAIPRFVLTSRIALGVISIYGLWCVLSAILNCIPVSAFWDSTIQGNCISRKFLWFFNASLNIVTDLVILIMPIPVLSRLHLPQKQKFGVIVVFAAGIFTCITSMIRLKYVATATEATDTTKSLAPIAGWSFIEMNMGIICSCLPPLHPLMTRALPWLRFIPRYHGSWFHMPYSGHHPGQDSVALARRRDPKHCDRGITITQELHLETLEAAVPGNMETL